MLPLDKLISFLNIEQTPCNKVFVLPTKTDDVSIFQKYIIESKFDFIGKKLIKLDEELLNKVKLFGNFDIMKSKEFPNSFLTSILKCIDEEFRYIAKSQIKDIIKEIRYKLMIDLVEKDYYHIFGYHKNRKMSRNRLEKCFMDEKFNFDEETEEGISCKNYIVDYFPIYLYVFDKDGKIYYYGTQREQRIATYPIVILYVENSNYYPVLKNNKGLYSYRQNNDVRTKLIDITETTEEENIPDEIIKEHDMEIEVEHMNEDIEVEKISEKVYSMEELKEIAKKHKVLLTYMNDGKRKKKTQEMLESELNKFL